MKMLFLPKNGFDEERAVAAQFFELTDCRTGLIGADPKYPIIGKYSVLPRYNEYCRDLKNLGLKPVNNPLQQSWSSHISHWYNDLDNFTAKTWFNPFYNSIMMRVLEKHGGPFFVRYDTKSKRELWKTHSYAQDYKALLTMGPKLTEDYRFENEIVAVREFLKLKTYEDKQPTDSNAGSTGIAGSERMVSDVFRSAAGQPIVKEFRIHRLYGQEICRHFYWEPFQEEIEKQHGPIHCCDIPSDWLYRIIEVADQCSNFYVLDVAQLESGEWTLIEVNEGQHSGVHSDFLHNYYGNMKQVLTEKFG
jgi:hypothetical protein